MSTSFSGNGQVVMSSHAGYVPLYINPTTIKQEPGLIPPPPPPLHNQQQIHHQQQQQFQQHFLPGSDLSQFQTTTGRMSDGGSISGVSNLGQKVRAGARRSARDEKLTPEEEERRKIRRERNKQAAARCRKRRMDQTQVLVEETEGLEEVQRTLREDIERMRKEFDEIQQVLQMHRASCGKEFGEASCSSSAAASSNSLQAKSDSVSMPPPPINSTTPSITIDHVVADNHAPPPKKPRLNAVNRPDSLPVRSPLQTDLCCTLAMPTPSPSKLHFNFDHSGLTPTGLTPTGLTPLIPNCSTEVQNKSPPHQSSSSEGTSSPNLVSL